MSPATASIHAAVHIGDGWTLEQPVGRLARAQGDRTNGR